MSLCQKQKSTFSGKQYTCKTSAENMGAAPEERVLNLAVKSVVGDSEF